MGRCPRDTVCNGPNTQRLVPRALDGLHKFCWKRNIIALWFLASSRNTLLPHEDMLSHLIQTTLCEAVSTKMRQDYVPPGTPWAQRELLSPSALLLSLSFFFFFCTATCPKNCAWILIKTKFQGKNIFIYKTNNTGPADPPCHFSLPRAIQVTFQSSQTCGC